MADESQLTGAQLRAARALLSLSGEELAERTHLGLSTIRRAEAIDGPVGLTRANTVLLRMTLVSLGVEFVEEDKRGGVGVRFALKPDSKSRRAERTSHYRRTHSD